MVAAAQLLAEGVGFEPTELSFNGFQDRRLKPLGHPSVTNSPACYPYRSLPFPGEGLLYHFQTAHIRTKRGRYDYRSVFLLAVLQDRYQRTPDREAGPVQRVDV